MSRAPEDDGAPIDDDVLDDDDPYQERVHGFHAARGSSPPHTHSSRPPRATAWSEVFAEGDLVARRYYISGPEQRTGALVTAPARHLELEQSVSLTYLVAEACEDPTRVARFLREVKLVARVPSAHTAKVLDVGRLKSGSPFAALEKPSGWTFAEVLRVRGPLPVSEACDYAIQACRAVAEAHAVGVRAITLNTENLVLTRASNDAALVKTVLFGASSAGPDDILQADLFRSADANVQRSLVPYLAPEHVRHTHAPDGPRAAVWALGTILYELIAGKKVINAGTPTGILVAIAADVAPKLGFTRPDVAPELEAVIERCLAKDPTERYSSIMDVSAALEPFVTGENTGRYTLPPRRVSRIPPPLPSAVPTARAIVRASVHPVGEQLARKTLDRAVTLGVGVLIGGLLLTSVQALRVARPSGDVAATPPAAAPQAKATAPAPVAVAPPPPVEPATTPAASPVSLRTSRPVRSLVQSTSPATIALNEAASTPSRTRAAAPASAATPTEAASARAATNTPAPSSTPATSDETGPKPDEKHGENLHATLRTLKAKARDTDLFDDLP